MGSISPTHNGEYTLHHINGPGFDNPVAPDVFFVSNTVYPNGSHDNLNFTGNYAPNKVLKKSFEDISHLLNFILLIVMPMLIFRLPTAIGLIISEGIVIHIDISKLHFVERFVVIPFVVQFLATFLLMLVSRSFDVPYQHGIIIMFSDVDMRGLSDISFFSLIMWARLKPTRVTFLLRAKTMSFNVPYQNIIITDVGFPGISDISFFSLIVRARLSPTNETCLLRLKSRSFSVPYQIIMIVGTSLF